MSGSSGGFYLMHRGWMSDPAFGGNREPFDRRSAWCWLIEEAAWKETRVGIGGRTVMLQRGQLSHSRRFMAAAWGWDDNKVARFLARLAEDQMVVVETGPGQMVITICNYDQYQDPFESGRASNGPAVGQTRKKEKKGKK